MKRTTRAKARWRRRLDRQECAQQFRETQPDFLAEEAMRIERAQYQDWLLSLEAMSDDERATEELYSRYDREAFEYDYEYDSYDDFQYDQTELYLHELNHDAYAECEHCKVLDAIRAIGGLESYLTGNERRFLTVVALRIRQIERGLRARKANR